jgi:acyl dehydratase
MSELSFTEIDLPAVPSMASLYRKAILHRGGGEAGPADRLQLADQPIDAERLWRYQQVCGFRVSDVLPPTYLHLLTFPLSLELMTRPEFPFPVLGLVHVGNEISQYRRVRADERVTLRTWVGNLRPRRSGRVIDLVSEVLVGDEPVWHEMSSYLHREPAENRNPQREILETDPMPPAEPPSSAPAIRWQAAADVGRRYAGVSGDRNPIHLHDLTAKLFGFRSAIAHGMWMKARTLAAFEGRLPERFGINVAFKAPVFLPSTVELRARPAGSGWQFQVRGVRSGKLHLWGGLQRPSSATVYVGQH